MGYSFYLSNSTDAMRMSKYSYVEEESNNIGAKETNINELHFEKKKNNPLLKEDIFLLLFLQWSEDLTRKEDRVYIAFFI